MSAYFVCTPHLRAVQHAHPYFSLGFENTTKMGVYIYDSDTLSRSSMAVFWYVFFLGKAPTPSLWAIF